MDVINRNHNDYNKRNLHIDNVLSTQADLGPKIPDGGYGWVILVASIFFQLLIPSLSVGFGIFLMFSRLETSAPPTPTLWDSKFVYMPSFFTVTWTLAEPLSRKLATTSNWPRLVSTAGTCLSCAGLLVMWIAINDGNVVGIFIFAGILTGMGASIITTQTDILISQYFHLKLEAVTSVLNAFQALGFIITPLALGHNIVKYGILHVITWYQAIILQGILISIAFKQPQYLKMQKSKYKLIRGLSDDEEDIFAKNSTELQNAKPSNCIKTVATIESASTNKNSSTPSGSTVSSTALEANSTTSSKVNGNVVQTENGSLQQELKRAGWETFKDDDYNEGVKKTKTNIVLHEAFTEEFTNDLDRIDPFEENYNEIPKPLFTEFQVNNNTSYAYEGPTEVDDPVVFMPINKSSSGNTWRANLEVFKQPTFYKSLLFHIITKQSVFVFWTFFPTYLYLKIDHLKVHHVTVILACINIGGLVFSSFATWIKSYSNIRAVFLWIFCWMGAVGYLILSDAEKQTTLLFGGIDISLSITALQILGGPLMKIGLHGETSNAHIMINTITGISFVLFFTININYKSCFRLMAVLQFLVGSLWLSNLIFKRIKKHFRRT